MRNWYTVDGKRRLSDGLTEEECDAAYREGKAEIDQVDRENLTGMAEEQADWDGDAPAGNPG